MQSTLPFANHDFSASKCIDGVTNNANGWNFCMSLVNVDSPWLSVELASGTVVSEVVVYAREDCCHTRLSPFEVWLSEAAGLPGAGARQCGGSMSVAATVGPHAVSCGGVHSSRYVTLLLPGPTPAKAFAQYAGLPPSLSAPQARRARTTSLFFSQTIEIPILWGLDVLKA